MHRRRLPNSFTSSYNIYEVFIDSSDASALAPALVSQMGRWIACFVVVEFDVDVGPDLKLIRPSVKFNEHDFRAICFSALPERAGNQLPADGAATAEHNRVMPEFHTFRFNSSTFADSTVHGNALFFQVVSHTASRGYVQQALVVLSPHYFPSLFEQVLRSIVFNSGAATAAAAATEPTGSSPSPGPELRPGRGYENSTFVMADMEQKLLFIDNAIANIANWPNPDKWALKRSRLDLPFLGQVWSLGYDDEDGEHDGKSQDEKADGYGGHHRGQKVALIAPFGSWELIIPYFGLSPAPFNPQSQNTYRPTPPHPHSEKPSGSTLTGTAAGPAGGLKLLSWIQPPSMFHADLYLVYEHLLLGMPILVVSASPHVCSMFISNALDLIKPIPYTKPAMEYLTMQTFPPSFPPPGGGIFGITNPMLIPRQPSEDRPFLIVNLTGARPRLAAKPSLSRLLAFNSRSSASGASGEEFHGLTSAVVWNNNKPHHKARLLTPQRFDLNDHGIKEHFHSITQWLVDLVRLDPATAHAHVPENIRPLYERLIQSPNNVSAYASKH